MSYIIAFVSFPETNKEFPTQCFRTDLVQGDEVIVRKTNGVLKIATITQLKYLNWDCSGRIECKRTESCIDTAGNITLLNGFPSVKGVATPEILIKELKVSGWIPVKSRQRIYRAVLGNTNATSTSYIFVRKNGIDIQVLPPIDNCPIKAYSMYERSLTEGRLVRHSLAHTTFNLFEGVLRFSNSFLNNETNLERYFVKQGSTDKRTDELKEQVLHQNNSQEASDIEIVGVYSDDMLYGYHCR